MFSGNLEEYTGKGSILGLDGIASYAGDIVKGEPCGNGVLETVDGRIFNGEFVKGNPHGKCTLTFSAVKQPILANAKYVGDWINGKKNGYGVEVYGSGDIYEGDWLENERSGHGVEKHITGDVFDGDWLNNDKVKGTYISGDKSIVYTGEFKNHQPHGIGKRVIDGNVTYVGEFVDGFKHGKGVQVISSPGNEQTYEGEFKDDKIHGKGKLVFSSGDIVYEGNFVKNCVFLIIFNLCFITRFMVIVF